MEATDRFTILDEHKNVLYNSKRKGNLREKEFILYDDSQDVRAHIYKEIDKKQVHFNVNVNEKKVAIISTNKGFTTKGFTIEPQGMATKHNHSKLVYMVMQNGELVGSINTKLFRLKKTYTIRIADFSEEFMLIMIALTMFIDERDPSFLGSLFKKVDWI